MRINLLSTTDAMEWAQEFARITDGWSADKIRDPGFMVGWFANAMAAQELKDQGNRRDG